MKAAETKIATATVQKKNDPFFQKKGMNALDNGGLASPFFLKSQSSNNTIQAKLSIGQPDDKYEKEADAVADKVVQRLSAPEIQLGQSNSVQGMTAASPITPLVQQKCAACEEEELQKKDDENLQEGPGDLQRKPIFETKKGESIQRSESGAKAIPGHEHDVVQAKTSNVNEAPVKSKDNVQKSGKYFSPSSQPHAQPIASQSVVKASSNNNASIVQTKCNACEQEDKIQKKEDKQEIPDTSLQLKVADSSDANIASDAVESGIKSTHGSGNAMPSTVQQQMESSFGADFSQVRIHHDSRAASLNNSLHAHAFAHGSDIYFNAGKYDYQSSSGQHLLAHELTHTIQQGAAPVSRRIAPKYSSLRLQRNAIQRFAPDEEKYYKGIDGEKAAQVNVFFWNFYKLSELKPLRENTPDVSPVAYANRTYDAQKLIKSRLDLYGKKIWVDGMLGMETLVFLRRVATDETLADLRFQIAGWGFDLDALASDKGFEITRQAEIDLLPVEFTFQWNVLTAGDTVMEHIEESKDNEQWFDGIIFGPVKPKHVTDDSINVLDRREVLKEIYKDVWFQGRASIVKANRSFLDKQKDGRRLVAQDPDRKAGNTLWVTYASQSVGYLKRLDKWFELEYPAKAMKLREEIGIAEVGKKRILTGFLVAFYLPEITPLERARIDLIVRKYLTDKEESIENFVLPKMHLLIELLDDEDQKPFYLGFKIKDALSPFIVRELLFERMATLMESHATKNYFDLLIQKTIQTKNTAALEMLMQLCHKTKFKDYANVKKALEILHGFKHNIQSHDYVTGEREEQGVWLEKGRDDGDFLKVGDVTSGVYRIEEKREQLKEAKRAQLQARMVELMNEHLANTLAAEEPTSQQDLTDEKFTEMILEKAAQDVKITEDDIEKVLYEQAFRLKGVKKVSVDGVDEYLVDYERVARTGGKGEWQVTEASPGMRSRWNFENDLGWYKFHNTMEALETVMTVQVVIIGGAVLLFSGGGAALVSLAGGAKVVGISIGISVLIYAITTEHFTLEGFLHAVLDGYLMALGFRFFTPLGGGIAKMIGTATFKQKLIGLILKSITVGGGSGAFTNVSSMLVEDILRGKLRSPEAYIKGAAIGFVLGAMFEIGGSLIIGPLFKAAGRNVLERISNIEQLKEFIKKSGIVLKPEQWGPEISKSFAGFVKWINENLDSKIGAKIISETKSRAANFLKSFAEGFELTVHRQALDLIEAGMTREAVAGLEKLIARSRAGLGKSAARKMVDDVLNKLVEKPERANAFFGLLKSADDDVMGVLLKDNALLDLATADAVLGLAAVRPPVQINNLLRLQFDGKVLDFESWARGLFAQDDAVQKQILDLLEARGASVTPESLIRIAQSGVGFSDEVVEGLSRMVRKLRPAGTLKKMEELLRLLPDDKMEAFFKTMNKLPDKTFDDVLKLVDDPAQASRLLKYADDPDQLVRLLEATGHKPADLDELFTLTKGKTKAPQEIESLLGRYANDLDKVKNLVKQVDGDAALLERAIARLNKADVEKILAKAQAKNVTKNDPASMRRFLQMAEKHSWVDASKLEGFIGRIHSNQAQPFKHTFADALDRLDDFVKHHSKSSAAPAVLPGHGPLNLAAKDSIIEITFGSITVKPHANANNLQHYKEGHTFENFWFDPTKIERAGASTFWPPGTTDDMILKDLMEVLNKPAAKTMIAGAHPAYAKSPPHIPSFDATEFQIGINLPGNADVNMFFPFSGSRAIKVSKHILHGVKDILGL